ncbi:MAG TPA: efflux RND transporter periplasmic adaptor subunit [Propionibacteriaceae bacterium]|nr:efflux RND transporter periplasmic adaptor subunit [Propionibacteriaceae bacterium]
MKRRIPVIVLVVVLAAGGLGWWWWSSRTPTASPPLATGMVDADQYQVGSLLSGRVTGVLVKEGDTVKAGQTVVTLDTAPLDLAVQQASQGVEAANATLKQAQTDGPDTAVAEAQARLKQAQASLDLATLQKGYATITAPHDGVVTSLVTNVGQTAAPGRTLMTLTDTTNVYARVFVAEPDLGKINVGSAVRVSSDGVTPSDGTVSYISSTAEFTPNTIQTKDQRTKLVYQVRVRIADTSGAYKPGLPVDVTLP